MASNVRDRILIIENDPIICDLISRQSLKAAGYQTLIINDASTAINKITQLSPDAIIVSLSLPGLNGKDLMVALRAQNLEIPVIVLAQKGKEGDIIQAFRLGVSDYLLWPVREAEVLNVVERVLRQVHERRERERLSRQLQQTNQELQLRVRELTTIFSIGKAVASITDQNQLFNKILEGATKVSQAEIGWFLLKDETQEQFLVAAGHNLPNSLMVQLNQAWDDGISSLVARSGEPLSIHGEPIKRFKISVLGQAAMVVPVKLQRQVIGILIVMRKQPVPFTTSEQHLIEAVADYASISLVNARLFKTVAERARSYEELVESAQIGEKIVNDLLKAVKDELRYPVETANFALARLAKDPNIRWPTEQRQVLANLHEQTQHLNRILEEIVPIPVPKDAGALKPLRLNDLVQQSATYFQPLAQLNHLTLTVDQPAESLMIDGDSGQINQVMAALLSNAIKFTKPGGRIAVRLDKTPDLHAHVVVSDTGEGIESRQLPVIFEAAPPSERSRTRGFGGLGISLNLAKEIITHHNGKIWVESIPGVGSQFHFKIPLLKSK